MNPNIWHPPPARDGQAGLPLLVLDLRHIDGQAESDFHHYFIFEVWHPRRCHTAAQSKVLKDTRAGRPPRHHQVLRMLLFLLATSQEVECSLPPCQSDGSAVFSSCSYQNPTACPSCHNRHSTHLLFLFLFNRRSRLSPAHAHPASLLSAYTPWCHPSQLSSPSFLHLHPLTPRSPSSLSCVCLSPSSLVETAVCLRCWHEADYTGSVESVPNELRRLCLVLGDCRAGEKAQVAQFPSTQSQID